jgi:hypothetical protein
MSTEMPNAPMSSGAPTSFFQVWINALTKPNERTFADIAASPNAKATAAYIWMFVASLVEFFVAFLVQSGQMRSVLEQQGYGQNLPGGGIGLALISSICGSPIIAVISVVFFAIFVAIIQWIAKMFGGRGTFDQMAYAFAAIAAPYTLISAVFVLLSAIPFVGFCFNILLSLAGIYVFVLEVMAVKGVNQFGWGQAIGSLILPGLALFLVCCCVIGVGSMLAGSTLQNVIQQIQQQLPTQ